MTDCPRVLHVVVWYPSEENPLFGSFVAEHVKVAATCASGAVLHVQRRGQAHAPRWTEVAGQPLPTLRLNVSGGPHRLLGLVHVGAGVKRLTRMAGPFDVVHAHVVSAAPVGALIARRHGLPLVVTEHWSAFFPHSDHSIPALVRPVARWCLERADRLLPVSEPLAKALTEFAPRAKSEVVPNVVDPSLFHPPERSRASTPPRLLTVGRLVPAKGIDVLLRALAELHALGHHIPLSIVGDGPDRSALERLSAGLGLHDHVTFHGALPRSDVADQMRIASAFVLASRYETFSIVCAEALACGLPVVATRSGGPELFLNDRTGILVTPGNVAELGQAMRAVLNRRWERSSLAATVKRFHPDVVSGQLRSIYDEVITERRG